MPGPPNPQKIDCAMNYCDPNWVYTSYGGLTIRSPTIIYENPLVSFKSHILPEGWNSISCCLLLLLLFFVQIKLVKSYSSPHIDTTLPAETLFGSLRAASARSTDYRCHPDGLPVQPLICFRYVYYASYLCIIMIEWFFRFLSLYVIYSLIVWITSTAHRL